jgi:hypothetical protein
MKNTIPGYMTPAECAVLRQLAQSYNRLDAVGVEVGSLHGRSSYELATQMPLGRLICIDGWDGYNSGKHGRSDEWCVANNWPVDGTLCTLEFFEDNVKDCPNITAIKGYSPWVVSTWVEPIDFVFIDALHANPSDWDNIKFWLPKLKPGGTLAGHDFYPGREQWPDVHDNVRKLEHQLDKAVINPANTSIWYFTV